MNGYVVIALSEGGLGPLRQIVAQLPVPCSAAVFVVAHIGAHPSILPQILTDCGPHPASFAQNGATIEAGRIYVAPPDYHTLVGSAGISLQQGAKVHYARPAAHPLFVSAAEAFGRAVLGVVLSGGDGDGAIGLIAALTYSQDDLISL